ncbi:MAG: hypothetical protein C0614_05485, partial [Desulfuromonas sp.]
TPTRPLSIEADPGVDLMRCLDMVEIPPTVNDLRASQNRLVVVTSAKGEKFLRASADLLRGLQWQEVKIITEAELTNDLSDNHDLIYFGWPQQQLVGMEIPKALQLSAEAGFKIDEESYQGIDDVLFVTLRRGKHVIGILTARTAAAAEDVARRIPHYGRYSYLVFSSGKNQLKGTWPATDSPLNITFDEETQQ